MTLAFRERNQENPERQGAQLSDGRQIIAGNCSRPLCQGDKGDTVSHRLEKEKPGRSGIFIHMATQPSAWQVTEPAQPAICFKASCIFLFM